MSESMDITNLSNKEWSKLASFLSGENPGNPEKYGSLISTGNQEMASEWKELERIKSKKEINVDKAWNDLSPRLHSIDQPEKHAFIRQSTATLFIRIAAVALLLTGIGIAVAYLNNRGIFNQKISISTGPDQKNLMASLSDGSIVYLNYNSRISYGKSFGKKERNVSLKGEAFFEIVPDEMKPFTIDAGKAKVKVLGTSFNVITDNAVHEVEVYVKSGKVALSDNAGTRNIVVEPGYVGTIGADHPSKTLNTNRNYLSWNTGRIVYVSEKLKIVFSDLVRIFNITINTSNPEILDEPITADWDNDSAETIIRVICATFNLGYQKDGNVYHLEKNNP
jgi:ferric-dicitrate binding protein FerR (iron transport regulator)